MGDHRAQATGGQNQWRHHRRPGEIQAQQQSEQHAVVAEQPGLTISLGIVSALRGEQPGDTTEQGAAEQGGRREQNGQDAQQAAQRIALEKDLAEAVEQGFGPVGAVGVEMVGRHGRSESQWDRVACIAIKLAHTLNLCSVLVP
ncbi:hypothetical protein D9M69_435480 [compost metagenome]